MAKHKIYSAKNAGRFSRYFPPMKEMPVKPDGGAGLHHFSTHSPAQVGRHVLETSVYDTPANI